MTTDQQLRVAPYVRKMLSTGSPGCDDILAGDSTRGRIDRLEGTPGTGTTTRALPFLPDGVARGDIELRYLDDVILLFPYVEPMGGIRTALPAVKSRVEARARTIREVRVFSRGLPVCEALTDSEGVPTGLPAGRGEVAMRRGDTADAGLPR